MKNKTDEATVPSTNETDNASAEVDTRQDCHIEHGVNVIKKEPDYGSLTD